MATPGGDKAKLQQHLELLREQYVKLQQRHAELEAKYTRALATSGNVGPDHFVSRLLKVVAELYDKALYSDITVALGDRKMPAHRFVLVARSRHWSPDETLASTDELDLSHMTPFVAASLIRWVYMDTILLPSEQAAMIELLAATDKYHLAQLKEKCEQALISSVSVRNCIKLYQTSEEHSAQNLKTYCLQMISSHWNDLNTSDFAELSAPLLYDMFKAHSEFPLHLAIQHCREDVVFLFLIENNALLPHKLNECDSEGNIPLNLALLNRHDSIANTLVTHKCDLDIQDPEGNSLLHLAILRGDTFAASFLIRSGANSILARQSTQETPLHLAAAYNPSQALSTVSSVAVKDAPWPSESMAAITSLLLEYHANPDAQDSEGHTPLQRAIVCSNDEVFAILLSNPVLNLDLRTKAGETALWLALQQLDPAYLSSEDISEYEHTFAARLIKRGANTDAIDTRTGNSLLHQAALTSKEAAAVFLVHHGAIPNQKNSGVGEAPIHIASRNGLHKLVEVLLQYGADPNLQTAIKPRPVTPALAAAAAAGDLSASSSASKLDDFGSGSILSPTALGALSALALTSQAASHYSFENATSGYSSLTGEPLPPFVAAAGSPGNQSPAAKQDANFPGTNPFGSDSDEDEGGSAPPPPSPLVPSSGYHIQSLGSVGVGPYRGHPGALAGGGGGGGGEGGGGGSGRSSPAVLKARQGSVGGQSPLGKRPPLGHTGSRDKMLPATPPATPTSPTGPDAKEFIDPPSPFDPLSDPGGRTALHLAIAHSHPEVVTVLLKHKGNRSSGKLEIDLNVNLLDGAGECALGLALWSGQFEVAQQLLEVGADIEKTDSEEPGLLYLAILREKQQACLFLLQNGADFKKRTPQNESLLLLSIRHQLEAVVDRLCEMGSDLSLADKSGNSPLWVALRSRQEMVATKLTIHGCDPNAWHMGKDGVTLTLLHRAILLLDTPTACFLIRNGADVNSPSRPGANGGEFSPPLHMACERGLQEVVQCLVQHNTSINAKDSTGRGALHVAIWCRQPRCSDILLAHADVDLTLKDKSGNTPFAAAMAVKDNEAGLAILQKEPKAAEQVDARGQNFLHLAVLNQDVEGVIFLLSVRVDINSKVQNPTLNTPLHYAVKGGYEILVRHLLLAEARVSDFDNHQRGVLHMAVEGDFPTILSVLLEHAADPDLTDEAGNSALHCAMQLGHMACVRVLLEESNINLLAANMRGETILHVLARHAKELAAPIFSLLLEVAPSFPVNKQDQDGNTPLLLAYFAGHTALCDALVKAGAHPSIANRQGVSIFNTPVATKQLLIRILDQIHTEPSWLEGNFCMNCNTKFNISHRKHHCRHCGRLLCKQCTSHQIPILKFELAKPVRVCEVCADSFRLGASR